MEKSDHKKPPIRFWFRNNWKTRYLEIELLPKFCISSLSWKDKHDSPRVETTPYFIIYWLGFQFNWDRGTDKEWELYIWDAQYRERWGEYPWKTVKTKGDEPWNIRTDDKR